MTIPTTFNSLLLLLAGCPRLIGVIALAPGLDTATVPPMVRLVLAGGLAVVLAPTLAQADPALLQLPVEGYLCLLASELALGVVVGFCLSCLLEGARLAGELIDLQIGFRAGEMYDPLAGTPSALLGRLWYLTALLFFFQINGHHSLVAGLARSFELCPVGALVYQRQLGLLGLELVGALFAVALKLAAPLIAALVLADLVLGLVGRGMPQMNLLLVGMPAKILVGLAALALSTPLLAGTLTATLGGFPALLGRLLPFLR